MTRFLGLAVFALAFALSLSYPIEEQPKEAVSSEKGPVPLSGVEPNPEPEVHEPVPADQSLPKSSEILKDEPVKEAPLPIEESPKKDELVSFDSFDADKSGYIEPAEWQLKAEESKKDKFSQVDVNGDSRISPEEFRGLAIPAEPQESASDDLAPAEVSSLPKEDKPVEAPVDEASAPVGRSAAADKVAPVDGDKPSQVVVDPLPKEPVVAESTKPDVVVEPVPAASVQDSAQVAVADEVISPKEGDNIYPGVSLEGDELKPAVLNLEGGIARPSIPEIRSDSVAEDIDDQVSEQKDPVLSDEVKSEEVKSEEVKSEEVKSDEVKSDEVKSEESRSEASRSEVPKSELPKQEEGKSEEVKSEVSKSEEVKSEELKPLEDKPQELVKPVELRSEEDKKEELKPEVAKAPVEEGDKAKEEDKVKEEVKVAEPVQSDEPAKVSEEVKKVEVAKDSSSFSRVRV